MVRRLPKGAGRAVLVVVTLCLLALFWPKRASAQFFSPGELARDHQEIDGDEHCSECHTAGNRVSNDKCITCHEDVGKSLKNHTGLHGRNYSGKPCGECHVDHRGKEHRLVRWNPDDFDHDDAGWALKGGHAKLECAKCHDGERNSRGHATYLGLSTTCSSCHEDKHQGRFGKECQSCHNEVRWLDLDLDDFDHGRARFPLKGKHAKVECAKCHGEPPKYQPLAFEDCGDCHKDPHRGKFGAQACADCHSEDNWKSIDMERATHPGLNILGGHSKVDCATCHDRGTMVAPSKGSKCVSCHAPVHEAPFGNDCIDCHAAIRWLGLPDKVGREAHAKTQYPLKGLHAQVDCEACHDERLPVAKRYRALDFDACKDCHQDKHAGEFASRQGGECAPCHSESGFAPAQFGLAAHATTKFPLTGKHEAVPCGGCHDAGDPRLRWLVADDKEQCAGCHDNPHGDQFRREMSQGGCAHCHSPVGWDIPTIDHSTWPLTGAHATARCDQCHTPTEEDRKTGTGVSYRNAPRECEGCHADPHLGQFRTSQPVRACDVCHDSRSFKIIDFDHVGKANYPLEGLHKNVECLKCHPGAELARSDGQTMGTTVRWRLGYRECRECHANPHEQKP